MSIDEVKERPILFSAPMVRAILEGRKTQTRRIVKPAHVEDFDFIGGGPNGEPATRDSIWLQYGPLTEDNGDTTEPQWLVSGTEYPEEGSCPLGQLYGAVGDRLWVRETHSVSTIDPMGVWYWADGNPSLGDWTKPRPSIHMPRWASRITLEITGLRVQRLHEISEADAIAEGIHEFKLPNGSVYGYSPHGTPGYACTDDPVSAYAFLWEKINGAESWDANPWVWVIEFKQLSREASA